jgi:hypothetical protein
MDKVTEIQEVNLEKANELLKDGDWIVLGCKANSTSDAIPLYMQPQDLTTSFIYSLGKLEPTIAKFA